MPNSQRQINTNAGFLQTLLGSSEEHLLAAQMAPSDDLIVVNPFFLTTESLEVSIGLLDYFYTGQSPDALTVFRAGQSPARRRLGVTGGCWRVWKGRPHPQRRVKSKHHRGRGEDHPCWSRPRRAA